MSAVVVLPGLLSHLKTPDDAAQGETGNLFGTPQSKQARGEGAPKPIKRVFAITLTEPGPFAFAGIWDSWKRPDGTPP